MIEELLIRDLGVIEEARLEFSPGLTVLTGETGAGKTMILTSLRLLMGAKAESTIVRAGAERAEVDGVFSGADDAIASIDLEEGRLFVWRTVPSEGRSRAALNGRPAPLTLLSEAVGSFVTIHGQADQWMLRREGAQRAILDRFAGHDELITQYAEAWAAAVSAKRRLDHARDEFDQVQMEIGYLTETTQAIAALAPESGEETQLDTNIERLTNSEQLRRHAQTARSSLTAEGGAADIVGSAVAELRRAAKTDSAAEALAERAGRVEIEIAELAADIEQYLLELPDDPSELEALLARRAELETLLKGRGQTVDELLEWESRARERLEELTREDSDPEVLEQMLRDAQDKVMRLGRRLHESRVQAGARLATAVNAELAGLSMKEADFRIGIEAAAPAAHGIDQVEMQLRSHRSSPHLPLGKGISGGELSRVMLGLEVALGGSGAASTYVFDEVDAGIGGHVAIQVGNRLKRLAATQQVVVVTHLPQVAAKADRHLVVTKADGTTRVETVTGESRVDEIVRMLGADIDSSAARRHASELLSD